jgi:hypothetical protein
MEELEPRRLLASAGGLPFTLGGAGYDSVRSVAPTPDGGFVVAGLFSGTANFHPGNGSVLLTSRGESDIFVARYSASGNLLYARQFGGNFNDRALERRFDFVSNPRRVGNNFFNGMDSQPRGAGEYVNDLVVDSAGNVYFVGCFLQRAEFAAPGQQSVVLQSGDPDYTDAFICKLDALGNTAWAYNIGARFSENFHAIALGPGDDIYVAGYFTRTVDLAPGRLVRLFQARGRDDGMVIRLDNEANFKWAATFGSDVTRATEREVAHDIAVDSAGNVFVTGAFAGRADFQPGRGRFELRAQGRTDAFTMLLSTNGKLIYATRAGGDEFDAGQSIALADDGSVYVGGYFSRTADFDPGPGVVSLGTGPNNDGSQGNVDLFLTRSNGANGALTWARRLTGGRGFEMLSGIELDDSGSVVASGSFYGTVDFDPGPGVRELVSQEGRDIERRNDRSRRDQSYDVFVSRISPNGAFLGARSFGSPQDDFVTVRRDGTNLLLGGRLGAAGDLDPGPGTFAVGDRGRGDGFVSLLSADLELL